MSKPNFDLPDPQRAEFEQRYKGMKPPHFRGGDVTKNLGYKPRPSRTAFYSLVS